MEDAQSYSSVENNTPQNNDSGKDEAEYVSNEESDLQDSQISRNSESEPTEAPTLTQEIVKEQIHKYLENNASIDIMAKNTLKSEIELQGHTIVFILANPLEKEKIESEKGNLLKHLRLIFNAAELSISYKVNVAAGSSRPYTPKEKFDAMITKNPVLAELKERLGLDTDY